MSPHLVVGVHNVCVDQDGFMYASDLHFNMILFY